MKKYKIVYNREGCIGAAACSVIAPNIWKLSGEDGKADLSKGKETSGDVWELEITEEELSLHKEAAESCPVNVIHIIDLETGKRIV